MYIYIIIYIYIYITIPWMLTFAIHQISGWTPAVWSATLIAGLSCQILVANGFPTHWDVKTLQDSENQQGLFQFLNTLGVSSIQWLIHVNTPMFLSYHGTLLSTSPILCGFPKCLFRVVWLENSTFRSMNFPLKKRISQPYFFPKRRKRWILLLY